MVENVETGLGNVMHRGAASRRNRKVVKSHVLEGSSAKAKSESKLSKEVRG